MEALLKILTCIMLTFLISTQLLLASPYRTRLTDDSINGRTLKTNETLIYKGTVMIDALGKYTPNSAVVFVNGEPQKIVDAFPIEMAVCDGDVVEVKLQDSAMPFYIFLASQKGDISADLGESTVLVHPGINWMFKVSPSVTG
jgi:hypothetical protein